MPDDKKNQTAFYYKGHVFTLSWKTPEHHERAKVFLSNLLGSPSESGDIRQAMGEGVDYYHIENAAQYEAIFSYRKDTN